MMAVTSPAVQKVAAALQQRQPAQPFMWGKGGEQMTPAQIENQRKVADGLTHRAGFVPQGAWSLLGALAGEGVAAYKRGEADDQEKSGQARVAEEYAKARQSGDYDSVLTDPFVSPAIERVAGAMQSRGWQQQDQASEWARQDARYARQRVDAAAAASRPKFGFFESGGDRYRFNENDPNAKPELFFDGPEAAPQIPDSVQALDLRAQRAGLQPGTPEYNDFMVKGGGGSGQTINVNSGGGDSDFYSAAAKARGQQFVDTETAGMSAQSKIGQINRLEDLLKVAPQGFEGVAKQFAGELGIPTEGLGSIQAVQGIINKMVPDQRAPGSGTMSDGDVALFKASLPRIVNQPGGNDLIVQTLKGIAVYEQQQGEIASKVLNHEMTPAEGREAMRAVKNPLELFRGESASPSDAGNSPEGVDPAVWSAMSPEERALWD